MASALHTASQTTMRDQFAREGYTILYPQDAIALGDDELGRIATGITVMMDAIYNRDPAATAQRAQATVADVRTERIYLFVVLDHARRVIASTRLSREPARYPDGPVFFEAGAFAKSPTVSCHFRTSLLMQAQMQWAVHGLVDVADYVVATTRVAALAPGRPFNGKILRYVVNNTTAMPSHAGYFYCVGPHTAEPFVSLSIPTDTDRWTAQVNRQQIFVPDRNTSHRLHSVLIEASRGRLRPDIRVCKHTSRSGSFEIFEAAPPSTFRESVYLVARTPPVRPADSSHPTGPIGAPRGLSDRVLIEHDTLRDPDLAGHAFHDLHIRGFRFSGWAPSCSQRGKIALVYGRPGILTPPVRTVARPDLNALVRTPAVHRLMTEALQRVPTASRGADASAVPGR